MLSTKLKEAAGNGADATLYVDDVFSTYLYTGNGSTRTITNGIDLAGKGGMVWIKGRNGTTSHILSDTNRGVNKFLISNDSLSELTNSCVTAFNSNGFDIGSVGAVNTSAATYASWTFRKAAKFFDVVTYTGNGVAGRQIAHSLGVAPGMFVVKRTSGTSDWNVYHRSVPATDYLTLNTAYPASGNPYWNDTAPTSTYFTLGSEAQVNQSGQTYVAYLYAHDTSSTGIIQCGSYVGNGIGSADGPVVSLGWEPQYLMVKGADTTFTNWFVVDNMRNFNAENTDSALYPNLPDAEGTVASMSGAFYVKSTGFSIQTSNAGANQSGKTYIYMAIRRPNKPPTTGTQVYNAITRSGTSAAATVTGVGFAPDLVASDARTPSGYGGIFVNKLSGGNKGIRPSAANSEVSGSDLVTQFNNTGYVLGADATSGRLNRSGNTYVNWLFCRSPTFFDVVCYTGTGSATTQAHNLTVVPELMIVKERSAVNNWWVYDAIDGNTKYSVLNSTAIPVTSATAWNNTTPTASVFSIGTATNVNGSAQTFVAYLFATLAGISKVGSYTGNGTGQAIACGFSAGARFVLIKRTDSTGDWYTFDSARGLTSGSSPYLLLNSTAAEVTGNNGVFASTGGFTLDATAITTTNIATATYIFLAVA